MKTAFIRRVIRVAPLVIAVATSLAIGSLSDRAIAAIVVYPDNDRDGYGDQSGTSTTLPDKTLPPIYFALKNWDPADADEHIAPGLIDYTDETDNDADGVIDEDGVPFDPAQPTVSLASVTDITHGETLMLDASDSSDANGMHRYIWSFNATERFVTLSPNVSIPSSDYEDFLTAGPVDVSVAGYNRMGVHDSATRSFNISPAPPSENNLALRSSLTKKIKKVKKAIKQARKKQQKARVKRLTKKLRRLQKRLRNL